MSQSVSGAFAFLILITVKAPYPYDSLLLWVIAVCSEVSYRGRSALVDSLIALRPPPLHPLYLLHRTWFFS